MKKKRYFYCYDVLRRRTDSIAMNTRVLTSIPLSRLRHTAIGRIDTDHSNGKQLTESDIGKLFEMEMIDPVNAGVVVYFGKGFHCIPEGYFKRALRCDENAGVIGRKNEEWCVFKKTGKNQCIIVVNPLRCKVTPI